MARGKIAIGVVHSDEQKSKFAHSLHLLTTEDWKHARRIRGRVIAVRSGPGVHRARNEMVEAFLSHPESPDWLLMIDSDMEFTPEDVEQLYRTADAETHPVVGGLCFAVSTKRMYPTIYQSMHGHDERGRPVVHYGPLMNYPRDAVCRVEATGGAFLIIHRRVFERMHERYGDSPAPWFAFTYSGKLEISEDITFCTRVNQLDIPVHVDTRVKVRHVKEHAYGEDDYDRWMADPANRAELQVIKGRLGQTA